MQTFGYMKIYLFVVALALIAGCKKTPVILSGGSGTGAGTISGGSGVKPPPVAVAGPDQTITILTHVTSSLLNGKQSFDSSGTALQFSWRQLSGPSNSFLQSPEGGECWVGNLGSPGTYTYELKVWNNNGADLDSVNINISFPAFCQPNRPEIPVSLTFLSNLPEHIQNPELIAAGNKLIIPGWFNNHTATMGKTMYVYDRISGGWTTTQASVARLGAATLVAGNKVFFAGGFDHYDDFTSALSVVDIYDVTTNSWRVSQLSEARGASKAVISGTRVFFAGGLKDANGTFSNKIDIYDLESESWSSTVLPGGARAVGAAVTARDKLLFFGGYTGYRDLTGFGKILTDPSKVIDIFDVQSGRWSADTMKLTKSDFAAVSDGANVFLAGGLIQPGSQTFAVEKWNVNTMTSTPSCLYQPMSYFNDKDAVIKNNLVVFFSNPFNSRTDASKFDIYNIQTGLWSVGVLPPGIVLGGDATAVTSVNNEIYAIIKDKLYKMNL
jgi:N-acetylneuraminic acid mutarotase